MLASNKTVTTKPSLDAGLLIITFIILGLGIIMVYSSPHQFS